MDLHGGFLFRKDQFSPKRRLGPSVCGADCTDRRFLIIDSRQGNLTKIPTCTLHYEKVGEYLFLQTDLTKIQMKT